jgi:hypothetical protein
MCAALRARRLPVPRDMRRAIALLHSYILVLVPMAEAATATLLSPLYLYATIN